MYNNRRDNLDNGGKKVYTISKTFSLKSDLWEKFREKTKEKAFSTSYVIRRLIEKWLTGEIEID